MEATEIVSRGAEVSYQFMRGRGSMLLKSFWESSPRTPMAARKNWEGGKGWERWRMEMLKSFGPQGFEMSEGGVVMF